jgi:hypothetical protein
MEPAWRAGAERRTSIDERVTQIAARNATHRRCMPVHAQLKRMTEHAWTS